MKQILKILLLLFSLALFSQNRVTEVVFFDTDSFTLHKKQKEKIEKLIKTNEKKIKNIEIKGFTDDRGTNNYNYNLAKNRINEIFKFIEKTNIAISKNVTKKNIGEIPLKDKNNTELQRAKHRKVEIILYLKKTITLAKNKIIKPKSYKKSSIFSINGQSQRRDTNNKIKDSLKSIKNEVYSETLQKHFEQVFKTNNQEVKFKDILFVEGWRISVRNQYYQYLYNLALFLKSHPYYSIELWGYYASIKKFNERIKEDEKIFGKKASEVVARHIISHSLGMAKYAYFYLKNKGVNEKQLSYKTGLIKPKKITQEKYRDIRVEIKIANK